LLDHQIVGYLFSLSSVDFVDILNICIHPKYQHQGLGRRLYSDFIHQVKKISAKLVLLEVRESNNTAIDFYQSLGFEHIDTRKKYYSNGENAKILRLQIM